MQYTGIGHRGGVFHLRAIAVQVCIYTYVYARVFAALMMYTVPVMFETFLDFGR